MIETINTIEGDILPIGPKGLSAYEIYVKNGGTLSETEWLASLKGDAGEKGDKGDTGSVKFIVVTELPTENIETDAIYIKPTQDPQEQNTYEEFIYVNNAWESLGTPKVEVDLSNYYNKEEANNLFDNKQDTLTAGENITIENNVISASGGITLDNVKEITGELTNLSTEDKSSLVNAINEVASSGGLKIFELFINDELVYFNKITGDDLTVISDFINYCKDNNGMAMLCLRFKNETVLFRLLTNYTSGSVIDIYSITPIASSNLLKTIKLSVSGTYADNKFTATNVTKYLVESNYAYVNNFLAKNNTTSYTPTSDYHPSTKKYVDDSIASAITTSLEASY